MGRTYLFECPRCEYRAQVSGRADRGFGVCVQTIVCQDCRSLYDVVLRLKVPENREKGIQSGQKLRPNGTPKYSAEAAPPTRAALNRLRPVGRRLTWVEFKKRCPVSALHRIQDWTDPEKCPRCGTYLERQGLPYRIWD